MSPIGDDAPSSKLPSGYWRDTALHEAMRILVVVLVSLVSVPALADALALSGRFGHWAVFIYEGADGKVCYAATKPRTWGPAEAGERLSHLQVSTFLNAGHYNEVSITLGADLDAATPAEVRIRKQSLPLAVVGGGLRPKDGKSEKTRLERMRKGRILKVQARAASGADLEYSFSLRGFDKALTQLKKVCK